jgi:acyl-CoA reductase-like NAD-dependent aldehyde dehydrogenase
METRLLIRGERVAGEGPGLAIENPATEEILTELQAASPGQVEAAVKGAREAARGWATTPAVERAELLHEAATRMRAMIDELARALTSEGGKPLIENRDEVGWAAAAFDYYAEMGRNFAGRVIPSIEATQLSLVTKEPTGVWGCIVPWNYPLLLLSWKLAPALAAGNTVVAKPSEVTPVSTLMLAECFADLAPGVVNLVAGAGDVGGAIVEDDRIDGVAFTGSVETGKKVAVACAQRVARMNLEMGGKDPFIVCADVAGDVAVAAKGGAWAAYQRGPSVHVGRALLRPARGLRRLSAGLRRPGPGAACGRSLRREHGRRPDGLGAAAGQGRGAGGGRGGRGRRGGGGRRPRRT